MMSEILGVINRYAAKTAEDVGMEYTPMRQVIRVAGVCHIGDAIVNVEELDKYSRGDVGIDTFRQWLVYKGNRHLLGIKPDTKKPDSLRLFREGKTVYDREKLAAAASEWRAVVKAGELHGKELIEKREELARGVKKGQ